MGNGVQLAKPPKIRPDSQAEWVAVRSGKIVSKGADSGAVYDEAVQNFSGKIILARVPKKGAIEIL